MSIMGTLLKAKRTVRTRVENALGRGADIEPQVVRREIFSQIGSKIVHDTEGSVFPFGKVVVRLRPQTKAQSDAIEESLIQNGTLRSDILQMFRDSQVQYPDELETLIELRHDADLGQTADSPLPAFEMDFIKSHVSHKHATPEANLLILKGFTEQPEYIMKKDRILIGRSREVLDREGRMVRRNDIVFLESEEEVNCSVGRTHARILFDHEKREFSILDEGSRYGTRILRGGVVVEVPGGDPRGIQLQSGDDVYLGQACFRFAVIKKHGQASSDI